MVDLFQRLPLAGEAWGRREPRVEIFFHSGLRALPILPVAGLPYHSEPAHYHVDSGCPLPMRLDMRGKTQRVFLDGGSGARNDRRFTDEALAAIAEHQAAGFNTLVVFAFLGEGIFHLEQVGEIGTHLDAYFEIDSVFGVVENGDVLVKTIAHFARADNGEGGIHIDRAGRRDQEELRGVVLQVVGRQGLGVIPLTVSSQRERKRVSQPNRPWVSVGRASMSPRMSLTTKVLPSRMLIMRLGTGVFSGGFWVAILVTAGEGAVG